MRRGLLALIPFMCLLLLTGVQIARATSAGDFEAVTTPTAIAPDAVVSINICPNGTSSCAYPVDIQGCSTSGSVEDGTSGSGGTDCGGVTVTGPDETEYIYKTSAIHIDSPNTVTLTFSTGDTNWQVEQAGTGCPGYTPVVNSIGGNTHCTGAYNVVIEGTAGQDVTGAPAPIKEGPDVVLGDDDEFKVSNGCTPDSPCAFTVPEFGAPVIVVSAVGLFLFVLYRKQHLLVKR